MYSSLEFLGLGFRVRIPLPIPLHPPLSLAPSLSPSLSPSVSLSLSLSLYFAHFSRSSPHLIFPFLISVFCMLCFLSLSLSLSGSSVASLLSEARRHEASSLVEAKVISRCMLAKHAGWHIAYII